MAEKMDAAEQVAILKLLDEGWNLSQVASKSGRSVAAISRLRAKYTPTTDLAARFIKASALSMVQRVVEKGTTDQFIDVLTRPNVGVLEPVAKGGGGDFGGVHISVSAGSVGAIVTATKEIGNGQTGSQGQHALLPAGGSVGPGEDSWATEGDAGGVAQVGPEYDAERTVVEKAPVEPADERRGRRRHGVQRLVQRDEKVKPRAAILNKKRPKSSIHLRYDVVEPEK